MPDENKNKYAPTAWAGSSVDLTVPSGQLCQVRKSSLQSLVAAGVIHDLDKLTGLVDKKVIAKAQGRPPAKGEATAEETTVEAFMADPKKFADLIHMLDRVTTHVVLQPRIEMTPNDVTRRVEGVVYADMVDLEDKLFIFQYAAGGTEDLETFRQQADRAVAGVDAGERTGGEAE